LHSFVLGIPKLKRSNKIMKCVALSSLVLLISFISSEMVPGVPRVPSEELVTVEGGANRWLCAASIVGAVASVATGSVPGAIVSGAGINKFC
jgi:hypothetical protein